MGLTSTEGFQSYCFKGTSKNVCKICGNLVHPICSIAMPVFHINQALSMLTLVSMLDAFGKREPDQGTLKREVSLNS
jgi:hypothetical protein